MGYSPYLTYMKDSKNTAGKAELAPNPQHKKGNSPYSSTSVE